MNTYILKYIKPSEKVIAIALLLLCSACSNYLDVVPEGTSTLDNAFSMRTPAQRYLYSCYSYLTSFDNGSSVDITGGDEIWLHSNFPMGAPVGLDGIRYAEGQQTALNPLWNFWPRFYQAIRDCNIFIENVGNVPNLPGWERDMWAAEAKVLKAYYHYLLLRQYGPVPIIRENLPISAGVNEVKVARDKADDVIAYAVQLIDEALPALPEEVYDANTELGRITRPIAMTIKSMILVTGASPLFNGNTMFSTLRNHDGMQLINSAHSTEKWAAAAVACEEAIDICVNTMGMKLYEFPGRQQSQLTDTIMRQMTLRHAFCEKWNSELIWADTKVRVDGLQTLSTPKLNTEWLDYAGMRQLFGPPLKIVDMFYSKNGIPIEEDQAFDYANRYDLRIGDSENQLYIREGNPTAKLHFDREPRFYAWLGFDNGIWYGQGKFDDSNPSDLWYVQAKSGQPHNNNMEGGSLTGYYVKKWMHYESNQNAALSYSPTWYVWPLFRLADLYLLYAESINEAADTDENREKAIEYVNKVRERAGLKSVQESWTNYSRNPNKYKTQDGLRQIIRQERMIELCFERKRFWDIRRWMTAPDLYQIPIQGWDTSQKEAITYYHPVTLFEQVFNLRDFFWPIPSGEVTGNPNLVQNIGW